MAAHVIVTVKLGRGEEYWKPAPFPGSQEAADEGCTCPIEQPWPGRLAFDEECPVHELERVVQ